VIIPTQSELFSKNNVISFYTRKSFLTLLYVFSSNIA
jgi:hypothetical protein